MFKNFIIFLNIFASSHADFSDTIQKQFSDTNKFFCDTQEGRSKIVPTSVHKLRPGDIDVIGAIGDSLTAANGAFATDIFQVITEARGKVLFFVNLSISSASSFK